MKLIAFDLDDTLLRDDLSISEYTVRVLKHLSEKGYLIVPASGRARKSMDPFLRIIGCSSYCISCNGAEIWDTRKNELLASEAFTAETGKRIAAFGQRYNCYSQTYEGDCFFFSVHSKYAEMYAASSMLRGVYAGDLCKFINEPRSKILMMDSPERIAFLLDAARKEFAGEASVTCSKPYFLEFNPVNATKGQALKKLCGFAGIGMNEIIAFGDSLNDLSMLKEVGLGVAVSNAREDVRSQCRDVCGSNMEDGVAVYLDNYFLQQEEKNDQFR